MSRPILKRFYRKECTRCGRKLDTAPLRPTGKLYKVLAGTLPTETVWCKRCSTQAHEAAEKVNYVNAYDLNTLRYYATELQRWVNENDHSCEPTQGEGERSGTADGEELQDE